PQTVGKPESSVMVSADAHARRRVVISGFLRSELIEGRRCQQSVCSDPSPDQRSANTNGHAIQKIPARDLAAHPQLFVFYLLTHRWSPGVSTPPDYKPASLNSTHF